MTTAANIAALYVAPDSIYKRLLGDKWCWDEHRDATKYPGHAPVICHPPCADYSLLSYLHKRNQARAALAVQAIRQVRQYGGVLEHPAHSRLWQECGLPPPGALALPDEYGGWTLEVAQYDYGHSARKMTWLYIVGIAKNNIPPQPPRRSGKPITLWQSARTGSQAYLRWMAQIREMGDAISRRKRFATPPDFADWLIQLARRIKCKPN